MFNLYKVSLFLCFVFISNCFATLREDLPYKNGDSCRNGGQWTDIHDCEATREFVQISSQLMGPAQDFDVLVCCDLRKIREACQPNSVYFEFVHVDLPRFGRPPHILMRELCDLPPLREGQKCTLSEDTGVWTYDRQYCDKYADTNGTGCCKLANVSAQKCQQYMKGCSSQDMNSDDILSFTADLYDWQRHTIDFCSAVLISDRFLTTNGWCLYNRDPRFATIGRKHNRFIGIDQEILHPNYENWSKSNVGLLRLTEKIVFSADIRPICLPQNADIPNKRHMFVAFEHSSSVPLRKSADLMTEAECKRVDWSLDSEHHFCLRRTERIPCDVKIGASVFVKNKPNGCANMLLGYKIIHSDCVNMVYVRLFPYVRWLEENIWK